MENLIKDSKMTCKFIFYIKKPYEVSSVVVFELYNHNIIGILVPGCEPVENREYLCVISIILSAYQKT